MTSRDQSNSRKTSTTRLCEKWAIYRFSHSPPLFLWRTVHDTASHKQASHLHQGVIALRNERRGRGRASLLVPNNTYRRERSLADVERHLQAAERVGRGGRRGGRRGVGRRGRCDGLRRAAFRRRAGMRQKARKSPGQDPRRNARKNCGRSAHHPFSTLFFTDNMAHQSDCPDTISIWAHRRPYMGKASNDEPAYRSRL